MDTWSKRGGATAKRVGSAVFGDRVGLILFLGATVFFGLTWRVDFFITDNLTIANTLANVADGHLYVDEVVYSRGTAALPGMSVVDGQLYGRNYGHVFFALPFLWLLGAIATVADPAVAIAGIWSLLLLAFCDQLGVETDRREQFAAVGAVLALTTFLLNVGLVYPIDSRWFPLMALQVSTILSAAFISVFSYRLLAVMHDRRTGVFAGAGLALATPVGVWATIPKRHTITALLVVLAVYSFYRSRIAESEETALYFRAVSYVWVGLTAWVHAPEGAVLLASLGVVDVATARTNRPKHLLVVGSVFAATLLPLLVTNQLVSGDPLTVPRMLPSYDGRGTIVGLETSGSPESGESVSGGIGNGGNTGDAGGSDPSPDRTDAYPPLLGVLNTVLGLVGVFVNQLAEGIDAVLRPENFRRTFLKRGNPEYYHGRGETINLAVLESMPLAALLGCTLPTVYRRWRRKNSYSILPNDSSITPERATDLLAVTYVALLVLIYAPRLPVHASITVRYLHPIYPLLMYFLARQATVQRILAQNQRLLVWSYAGFVLLGGQLLVVALVEMVSTPGAAIQFHGLLALATAGLLLGWTILSSVRGGYERTGAVLLALAGAVTTLFVVLSAHVYFGFMDRQVIPFVRVLSEALSFL